MDPGRKKTAQGKISTFFSLCVLTLGTERISIANVFMLNSQGFKNQGFKNPCELSTTARSVQLGRSFAYECAVW